MYEALIETLPLPRRLALSYASKTARPATLALFALDERLSKIVSGGGEPMIAQLKLAWWRDRLTQPSSEWPEGEPLLALLREWPGDPDRLVSLVDGWETLLSETFDRAALTQFIRGKVSAWTALADGLQSRSTSEAIEKAAEEIALFELAKNLSDQSEIALARHHVETQTWTRPELDRKLRPMAVLHVLAKRALKRGKENLLDGPGALATAMKVGITGR